LTKSVYLIRQQISNKKSEPADKNRVCATQSDSRLAAEIEQALFLKAFIGI